MMHKPLP
jgi:hypothetical protein